MVFIVCYTNKPIPEVHVDITSAQLSKYKKLANNSLLPGIEHRPSALNVPYTFPFILYGSVKSLCT